MAQNSANGDYNSLQLTMRGSIKSDLTYQVGYTYSHANDPSPFNGNGGDLDTISNPYAGWKYDFGPSVFDRRQVFFANFVYQIPFLKNSENKLLKTFVGGWEVSGVVVAQSGAPLNIGMTGTTVCSVGCRILDRPDLVGPITYPHTVAQWFSTSSFAAPALGTWGKPGPRCTSWSRE